MELKLSQELSGLCQSPLVLVFLELREAYDTMDRERVLITLEVYGAGLLLCGILETF